MDHRAEYLAVLPELRELGRRSRNRLHTSLAVLLPLGVLAGAVLADLLGGGAAGGGTHSAPWLVVLNLVLPGLLLGSTLVTSRLSVKPRKGHLQDDRLMASGLADRIEVGELLADPLLEHLGAAERRRVEERDKTPLQQLLRVCSNFLWYVTGSKASLFTRRHWGIALLLGLVMLLVLLALWPAGWIWLLACSLFNLLLALVLATNSPGETGIRLADYLDSEWHRSTTLTPLPADSTAAGLEQGQVQASAESAYDRARIAHTKLIISDIEFSSMQRNLMRGGSVDVILVLPPSFALLFVSTEGWSALICAVALATISLLVWRFKRDRLELEQQRVDQRLQRSTMALELASGSLSGNEALEHAPSVMRPLLRFFNRHRSSGGLRGTVPLIADNLDWYLARRGPLWRWHWLAWLSIPSGLLGASALAILSAARPMGGGLGMPTVWLWLSAFLLLAPLFQWWLSHAWLSEKQVVWSKALTNYLRQHAAGE